jgi:hypothetical protein
MDAAAEGEVSAVGPANVEGLGIGELAWVATVPTGSTVAVDTSDSIAPSSASGYRRPLAGR